MADIVWRKRAIRHVNAIAEYLHERNPGAAAKYVAGLYEASLVLRDFPEKGRAYDGRYRVLVFRNHIVFYYFEGARDRIVISAVIDGRRDVSSILDALK